MLEQVDVVIVGAGAAGLMAAIQAGRTFPGAQIVLLDGAKTPGAKILVAGGGRCNVTHDAVDESAYAGASRHAIRKVLRRFDVPQTVAFFRELGVTLKREDTGKLFPTTDRARTVLDALLQGVQAAGVTLRQPRRVEQITREADGPFCVQGPWGHLRARRVILATGGCSLPKSGSDGHGYRLAQALGHTVTAHIFPALVPLLLPAEHFLCALSGLSAPARLEVVSGTGQRLAAFTGAALCTHFGLSGPAVLDISRYWQAAQHSDPAARLLIAWLPEHPPEQLDQALQHLPHSVGRFLLAAGLPERLARALCAAAGVEAAHHGSQLPRAARRALVATLTGLALPVTGTRGYTYAEVTAGGVPLTEIHLKTMASRPAPGLFLCGEICDVDGRIGGYNFQWAWASGYVAGSSALLAGDA